jgi:hypothetical protein
MSTKVKIILGLVGAVVVAGILIDVTGGSSGSGVSKYYTEGYNAGKSSSHEPHTALVSDHGCRGGVAHFRRGLARQDDHRLGRLRASCSADANALVLAQRLGCIADALVLAACSRRSAARRPLPSARSPPRQRPPKEARPTPSAPPKPTHPASDASGGVAHTFF